MCQSFIKVNTCILRFLIQLDYTSPKQAVGLNIRVWFVFNGFTVTVDAYNYIITLCVCVCGHIIMLLSSDALALYKVYMAQPVIFSLQGYT